jgi:DNA-binding MarR family transcriptional regulator
MAEVKDPQRGLADRAELQSDPAARFEAPDDLSACSEVPSDLAACAEVPSDLAACAEVPSDPAVSAVPDDLSACSEVPDDLSTCSEVPDDLSACSEVPDDLSACSEAGVGESGEPRWLSPYEQRVWASIAGLLVKLPGVLDAQLQRDSGLTMFEYLVLSSLSTARNRTMRMSDLASFVNGSLSRLSNVIKRLEQRGWVRRERAPDNGRYTNAVLTEEGWALVVSAAPGHVRAVRHFVLDPLSEDHIEAAGEIGRRIVERADPDVRRA